MTVTTFDAQPRPRETVPYSKLFMRIGNSLSATSGLTVRPQRLTVGSGGPRFQWLVRDDDTGTWWNVVVEPQVAEVVEINGSKS